MLIRAVAILLAVCLKFMPGSAAADEPRRPTVAANSLATFRTLPGFHVELVAAEPLIRDPVSIAIDENGRMYVVEFPEYNSATEVERAGTVKLLEDINGDGQYDKSHVFLAELDRPSAVACYDGGVFVGVAPDILYCKDTDGDGKADVRKVVFTGFSQDSRKTGQARLNSFRWGLDNRIHVSTNYSGGDVKRPDDQQSKPVSVRNRGFLFDPKTLDYEATSGGGQHGQAIDDWGLTVLCKNSDPFRLLIYDDRYLAHNRLLKAPPAVVSITAPAEESKLFRISPEEPWRVRRTKLRASGQVRGAVEHGGKSSGYFTSATGVTFYRGHAWPDKYRGDLFIGEVANNVVHHARLQPKGVGYVTRRGEPGREFLASTDIAFRPVQFANAPDGTLYVVDMHRALIEGTQFLPPELLKEVNVREGSKRGRIYRIAPGGFRPPQPPRLAEATTPQLVALLEHPGGWHRDTAARLLFERQDLSAVQPLRKLASGAKQPWARMHAWYALDGMKQLDEATIINALGDSHPRAREHALRLAEKFAPGSSEIRSRMRGLADDADLRVRFQLLFSAATFPAATRSDVLTRILIGDSEDAWMQLAALTSTAGCRGQLFANLIAESGYRRSDHGREILLELAAQIGAVGKRQDVNGAGEAIATLAEQTLPQLLALRMAAAMPPETRTRVRQDATEFAKLLNGALSDAKSIAVDADRNHQARQSAIRTLSMSRFSDLRRVVAELLELRQPQSIQSTTLETLGEFEDDDVATVILSVWPRLSPTLRAKATETLLSRPAWIRSFLAAIDSGSVARGELDQARMKLLAQHPDEAIRNLSAGLFAGTSTSARQEVVKQYQQSLRMAGDAVRGKLVFGKVCSACHRLENVGSAIGADLKAIRQRGDEAIVLNVLDPNREVKPQYLSYVMITDEGLSLTGMIRAETANSITIRQFDGKEHTMLRANIEAMRSTGLSFMPEGLEKQVDARAMADLLAYLKSIR